ncbi:16S rRNA processing protein RimM [hydrothermal vent metagenome]|uniref:16S rRNA processing protein RimM n=1 Tax=hydrothermal vent metagenome TaxID=652676 RepID=A0A3B1D2B7_9ZZZZ
MTNEWVPVGTIPRTHGLKGEFKFHPFVTEPGILNNLNHLKLKGGSAQETEFDVESLRGMPGKLIVKLKGINNIDDAEAYTGQTVLAPETGFKELPKGEYYWFQVLGLNVYDEDGHHYGQVTDIIETGSNDVYVVQDSTREDSKEILIPMIDWVVKNIDIEEKKLVFDNVEGLIEDTEV